MIVGTIDFVYIFTHRYSSLTPWKMFRAFLRLVTQDREAKRAYKQAFEALTKAKAKMEASTKQEEALRRELLLAFDSYSKTKVQSYYPEMASHEGFVVVSKALQRYSQRGPHRGVEQPN